MSSRMKYSAAAGLAIALAAATAQAQGLSAEIKPKVEAKLKQIQAWSTDPAIVSAVNAYNSSPPAEASGMTNEKWKLLTVLDPFVRSFSKNALGTYLKGKKDDQISEIFVSAANGNKVGFLAKTTSWCHLGKSKHDVPMTGKKWIGPVEVDESTGIQQVQVAVPVMSGAKPVGSIVIGLSIAKL